MNIYFAASIRGGRGDVDLYVKLIEYLKRYGEVMTDHVSDRSLTPMGEKKVSVEYSHNRDMAWMAQADVMIAEVTAPSLGVGYELAKAGTKKIPVLCLYRPQSDRTLSAMVRGCKDFITKDYETFEEAKKHIDEFLKPKI
jgi:2'-deoxynucleoside 5'-phosphate N-hydrolase